MNNDVKNAEADELIDANESTRERDVDAEDRGIETAQPESSLEAEEAAEEAVDSVEGLRAKVASLEDNLLRAKAEHQNFQRRAIQEQGQALRYANAELMRGLLGVLDDFERSMEAAKSSEGDASVADGVRLVYDNLTQALRTHGLESIDAVGKPFDPHVHEAMMQQPSADHPPDTVLAEVAKGYRLGERVLRPAKVIVSKAGDDVQADDAVQSTEDDQGRSKKKSKKNNKAK